MFLSHIRTCFLILLLLLGATFAHEITSPVLAQADPTAARRAELQSQLNALEKEIQETQSTLNGLKSEGQSIQRDISILDADIRKSELQIRAIQVQIEALSENITLHSDSISQLTFQLDSERAAVAEILRKTREIDDYSLVEVVLSAEDVSSFFSDLDDYVAVKQALGESSAQLTRTRSATETEKDALIGEKTAQEELRAAERAAQAKVEDQKNQKRVLLAQNQSETATYQSIYDTQQKSIAQIRAELFALAGGSGQISLPIAIQLAKNAGAATGVRPSLILGILKQETNLGQNVGQCLLTNDPKKGDGKGKNTGTFFDGVMKPERDVDPFMAITAKLGIDPYSQVVSCPPSYGYGGAMGPSQFIPSTWVLYEARIARALGVSPNSVSPWNNLHAFTATAMLLADNGATAGTREAERTAALRYFAGWGNAGNPAYAFYGDGVMGFADQFEADIQTLGGN